MWSMHLFAVVSCISLINSTDVGWGDNGTDRFSYKYDVSFQFYEQKSFQNKGKDIKD